MFRTLNQVKNYVTAPIFTAIKSSDLILKNGTFGCRFFMSEISNSESPRKNIQLIFK